MIRFGSCKVRPMKRALVFLLLLLLLLSCFLFCFVLFCFVFFLFGVGFFVVVFVVFFFHAFFSQKRPIKNNTYMTADDHSFVILSSAVLNI